MNIGIIGAGNIGANLARIFTKLGLAVSIANSRGPETLRDLARETGATPVTPHEAARAGELVVVTIPEKQIPGLAPDFFAGVPEHVIVVDTGNYYPQQRDGKIDAIESGTPESAWVASQLGRPVLKAFNNIYAEHLISAAKAAGAPGRVALPYAGDDAAAKRTLAELIESIGFDAIDTGTLAESWRQQPGTPVYGTDFDAAGVRRALAEASPQRSPEWRATPQGPGTAEHPQ